MNYLNRKFFVGFYVFLVISSLIFSSAQADIDETIRNNVTTIFTDKSYYPTLTDQISGMSDILLTYQTESITLETQNFIVDKIINEIYRRRSDDSVNIVEVLAYLSQLLNTAQATCETGKILKDIPPTTFDSHLETVNYESDLITILASETQSFSRQVTQVGILFSNATGKSFEQATQTIFFKGLENVVSRRATINETTKLATVPSPLTPFTNLKNYLTSYASRSPLLTDTSKAKANEWLTFLTIEQNLLAIRNEVDYIKQINLLKNILTDNANLTVSTITQAIAYTIIKELHAKRNTQTFDYLLTNNCITLFKDTFAVIRNATFFNATYKNLLLILWSTTDLEANIISAHNQTDYATKLNSLSTVLSSSTGIALETATKNLMTEAVLKAYKESETIDDIPTLNKLLNILNTLRTHALRNTTKQADIDKAYTDLAARLKFLEKIASIINAWPQAPSADLPKPLPAADEQNIFNKLQESYNNRNPNDATSTAATSLPSVKNLLRQWIGSTGIAEPVSTIVLTQDPRKSYLSNDHTKLINEEWITKINEELFASQVTKLISTWPQAPTTDLPRPLPAAQEQDVFSKLQESYNNRNKNDTTSTAATSLPSVKRLLKQWIGSTNLTDPITTSTLTQDPRKSYLNDEHTKTINEEWIPTIIREMTIASIIKAWPQSPSTDLPKPLPEADEAAIFSKLQTSYNSRNTTDADSTATTSLTSVKTLLKQWIGSTGMADPLATETLTQDPRKSYLNDAHTKTVNEEWIAKIDAELLALKIKKLTTAWPQAPTADLPKPLPEAEEQNIFGKLQTSYNNRNKNDADSAAATSLTSVKTLLKQWIGSTGMSDPVATETLTQDPRKSYLNDTHTKTVNEIWVLTINQEIENLRQLTNPDFLNHPELLKPPLSAEQQNKIFDMLKAEYENRRNAIMGKSSDEAKNILTNLKDKLNKWAQPAKDAQGNAYKDSYGSNLYYLNSTQIATITDTWIPTIEKEIRDLENSSQLSNPDILNHPELLKPPLSTEQQNKIFEMLKAEYDNRKNTIAGKTNQDAITLLTELKNKLNTWIQPAKNAEGTIYRDANGADLYYLNNTQITTISGTWIPTIDKEIETLRLLLDPSWPKGPEGLTKPLSPIQENLLFAKLKESYDNRDKTSVEKLTTLKNTLKEWIGISGEGTVTTASLITTPRKSYFNNENTKTINETWIPTINDDINRLKVVENPFDPKVWPPKGPFTDDQQDAIFAKLKGEFDARTTNIQGKSNQDAITFLTTLWNTIDKWHTSNLLPKYNTNLSTMKNTLTGEINALKIVTNPTDPSVNPLDPKIPTFTEDQQDAIFAQLKTAFDSRTLAIKDRTVEEATKILTALQTLFKKWLDSGKLPKYQSELEKWIQIITSEISALTITTKPADPNLDLSSITELTTDQQLTIFLALKKAYDGRKKTIADLNSLTSILTKWTSSGLLSAFSSQLNDTYQHYIETNWLTVIRSEVYTLTFITAINAALKETVYQTRLDKFINITTQAKGKTFVKDATLDVTTPFFTGIKYLFDKRTINFVDKLIPYFQDVLTSPLLSQNNQAEVTAYITKLLSEKQSADIIKLIAAALAQPDYGEKLKALSSILEQALGKTFESTAQLAFFNALKQVFNERTGKSSDLINALTALLSNSLPATLIDQKTQRPEVERMLSQAAGALQGIQLTEDIKEATTLGDYIAQLNALYAIVQSYTNAKTAEARIQEIFFNALKQVFDARRMEYFTIDQTTKAFKQYANGAYELFLNRDDITIDKLNLLLTAALKTPLISSANIAKVTFFSQILSFEIMIINIPRQASFTDQLNEMLRVIQVANGKSFDTVTNDLVFSILYFLFDYAERTSSLASPQLSNTLVAATISPLLNTNQQQQVKSWITETLQVSPATTQLIDQFNSAMNLATPSAQLQAILKLTSQPSGITIDPSVQNTFGTLLLQLYNQLISGGYAKDAKTQTLIKQLLDTTQQSPLLTSNQKTWVNTNMTVPFYGTISQLPQKAKTTVPQKITSSTIQELVTEDDASTTIANLSDLVTKVGKKTKVDTATTQAFEKALNSLTAKKDLLSPADKAALEDLVNQTTKSDSPLLSGKQKASVKKTSTKATIPSKPTTEDITNLIDPEDPAGTIASLTELAKKVSKGTKVDTTSQEAVKKAISDLTAKKETLSPANKAKLEKLIKQLTETETPLLDETQKTTVRTDAGLPAEVPAKTTIKTTPAKEKTTPAKATTKEPTTKEKPTTTVKPTAPDIVKLVDPAQPAKTIENLTELVKTVKPGTPLDPETQKTVKETIEKLIKEKEKLSPTEKTQLETLVKKITEPDSPLIAPAQKTTIRTEVGLPTTPTTPKPTIPAQPTAPDIVKLVDPAQPATTITKLTELVKTVKPGTPIDPETQKTVKETIEKLIKEKEKLSPDEQEKLTTLIKKITEPDSPLLSPAQKTTIRTEVGLPATPTTPKPTIPTQPTAPDIIKLVDPAQPAKTIENLIELTKTVKPGTPLDPETQKTINDAIKELIKEKEKLSPDEQTKLTTLIKKITDPDSPLIAPAQKTTIRTEVGLPATPTTPKPTIPAKPTAPDIVKLVDPAQPAKTIENLIELTKTVKPGTPPDPETQKTINDAIKELIKVKLPPDEKTKLETLIKLITAPESPLLSPAQKTTVRTEVGLPATPTTPKPTIPAQPTAPDIVKLVDPAQPAKTIENLIELTKTVKPGTPPDPETQKTIQKTIEELITKKEQLTPEEKEKLIILIKQITAPESPLLSPAQKTTVRTEVGLPVAPTTPVKEKTISTAIQEIKQGATITPEVVTQVAQPSQTAAAMLTNLQAIITAAIQKPLDPNNPQTANIQLAIAKVIAELDKKMKEGKMTAADLKLYQTLLTQLPKTNLLATNQLAYVKETMLKEAATYAQSKGKGALPSVARPKELKKEAGSYNELLKKLFSNIAPKTKFKVISEILTKYPMQQASKQEQRDLQKALNNLATQIRDPQEARQFATLVNTLVNAPSLLSPENKTATVKSLLPRIQSKIR